MNIETTPRDDHQVKMIVKIEANQFDRSMHQAARKIANRIKIPGFRPGKAPYDMVIRQVGEPAVKEEAIDLLISEVYPQALKEANLTPGAMGKLEKLSDDVPPTFEFLVPLAPEVKLGDYHAIRKEYKQPVVDDHAVDEFIDKLRTNYATSEPVEREVKRGDIVYLTLSGILASPTEGENAAFLKEGSYPVLVPEKESNPTEWPYPGFGDNLVGKSVGFEGTTTYQYSEDSDLEHLRGKKVEFKFKIDSVKKLILPELDEAFLQMLGEQKSVDEFKKSIRQQLETRAVADYEGTFSNQLVEEIRKTATIKYPPQVLEEEIEEMLKSFEHDLSHQKMDLATYLKTRNLEKAAFIESEVKPAAVNRLERSLVMDEFTRAENIQLDMSRWDEAVNETARELSYSTDLTQLRKKLSRDQLSQAVSYETANRLMNKQLFERMKAIANGESVASPTENSEPGEKSPKPKSKKKTVPAGETNGNDESPAE